ncbi:rhodanese-like domain-containing protein [Natronobiforma cellulositropha]|uniref:rhodanese-like domain-containing protein n=1 Tax=Natronobiforma cellulositropha TaxID=1679076 RepID=UPI0021D5E3E5|nr:rhodanese-like domain-containing protein [Natronobiforma cellulositropha]
MNRRPPLRRRHFLAGTVSAAIAVTAGCTSSGEDDDTNGSDDDNATDDDADAEDTNPSAADDAGTGENETDDEELDEDDGLEVAGRSYDVDGYDTEAYDGTDVPLVPVADAHDWFGADDVHFVDTRGQSQFAERRIDGAVSSPADDGLEDDPIDDWSRDKVLVTYCDCPHSIAARRSVSLLEDGFENVFILEGGLEAWADNDYPVAGGSAD